MKKLHELREKYAIIKNLAEWQKTVWYPAFFALLGLFSSVFGMAVYIPIFWVMTALVVFSALFCDDLKVLLVPLIIAYYCIGLDVEYNEIMANENVLATFHPAGLANLLACGGVMFCALAYRFVVSGVFRDAYRKRGIFSFGLFAVVVACLTNGIFSPEWQLSNLAIGFMEAAGFGIVYFIVLAMTDKTADSVAYACKVTACLGFLICGQILVLALRLNADGVLFVFDELGNIIGINRSLAVLPWGVFNLVGAVLAVCVLATLYLAHNRRYPVLSYLSAIVMYMFVVFTNGRTAILIGGIVFAVYSVVLCVSGKNRKVNRIITAGFIGVQLALFFILVAVLGGFNEFGQWFAEVFRFESADSGRFVLWKDGLFDFTRAPVFGVGFLDGGYAVPMGNAFSGFYHNVIVEVLGAMGIIGALAAIVHLKNWFEVTVRRYNANKLLVCLIPMLILMMSMLDNFVWYLNVQILYGVFLALAERKLEDAREEAIADIKPVRTKPRVVFTFVEAGKGHIIPVRAVCDAFKAKYGDCAEVVESHFYTETENPKLIDFEKGFALAVKIQSRHAILGKLCNLGNFLAGDALAQEWLMAITPGGIVTKKLGIERMKELDADFVFTAHWSTAYYAKHLKDRPYVMMFCPDAYANGMFNMDCNELLMPTEAGYRDVVGRRLYAGGNVTEVPFPIRSTAEEYLHSKAEFRASLGISSDSFVITLCDGGYGLANLERTAIALSQAKEDITVIALCGTNEELRERLENLATSPTVRIIPVGYSDDVLGYIACADLFMGKGGANSMAEPAYFGVPVIITKCITYIEKGMKKYYVNKVGGALFIPDPEKAGQKAIEFARDRDSLKPYAERMRSLREGYGADKIADLIWERLQNIPKRSD